MHKVRQLWKADGSRLLTTGDSTREICLAPREPGYDDSWWQDISVPHSFNAEDTFIAQRGYYRGPAWYRCVLPDRSWDRRTELQALGSFAVTDVWLNGIHLGSFMGGFTGFTADLTPHLGPRRNVLVLRVTNEHDPEVLPGKDIPDYDLYGGVYREIGLRVTDPVHIPQCGIIVTTPAVSEERGTIHLNVSVRNDTESRFAGTVAVSISDPSGAQIADATQEFTVAPGVERLVHVPVPEIESPSLWSPDEPSLYTVSAAIVGGDEATLDQQSLSFGFRWFDMDADKGFF